MYGDEDIIRKRVAATAAKAHNISNRVTIAGVDYSFSRREFDFGFSMLVPEEFEKMPEEAAQLKFPSIEKPKAILANRDYRVCLTYNDIEPLPKDMNTRVSAFRAYTKKIRPANVFLSYGVYDLSDNFHIGHYDYSYPVANGYLYNITFLVDLPDVGLLGRFVCPIEVKDKWEPLMRQMIQSIQVTAEEVL